jgi:hypothetical protein
VLSTRQKISESLLVRSENFEIEVGKEVSNILLETNSSNFKCLLTLSEPKLGWQAYLVDPFGT